MSLDQAIQEARKSLNKDMIPATLGDGNGNVYDLTHPGFYYCRKTQAGGTLSQPFSLPLYPNSNIPPKNGLSVYIGYDEHGNQCIVRANQSGLLSANISPLILNPLDSAVYGKLNSTDLATFFCQRHGDTTNFPLTVVVMPGWLEIDGTMFFFPGGSVDLTSLVPGAGLHAYAVVFIRTDLTLEAFASTPQDTGDPLTPDDINEAIVQRTAGSLTDWAWELANGESAISPDPTKNVDLRQWMNVGSSGGSGTVTSVGLSTDASYLTVGSSPVTSSGTITLDKTTGLAANQVVATPNGSTGAADVRALVAADLPNTAVTPASYTNTSLTVDAQGRITAASNGTVPAPSVLLAPVKASSASNVNIASAPSSFDGITPSSGNRILLFGQTTASQNGIWVFNGAGSALSRPSDFASGSTTQAYYGVTVEIQFGDVYGGNLLYILTTGTITIDTTSIDFSGVYLYDPKQLYAAVPASKGGTGQAGGYTKGDLLVATTATTLAKQAVGADGKAVIADSSLTNGLGYKGVWVTLSANNILTGNAASFDLTSIPAGFSHLKLYLKLRSDKAAVNNENVYIRMNADSTAAHYYSYGINESGTTVAQAAIERLGATGTGVEIRVGCTAATATSGYFSYLEVTILNYAQTNTPHQIFWQGSIQITNSAGTLELIRGHGLWTSTSAINQLTILPVSAGNFVADSSCMLMAAQ